MRVRPAWLRTRPAALTPIQHAQALDWPGSRPTLTFFKLLEREVSRSPSGTVAVGAGAQAPAWSRFFANAWPELTLVVVTDDDDEAEAHVRLCISGRFDVIVQAADTSALSQARMFQRMFPHLRQGGVYLTPQMLPWTEADQDVAEQGARLETPVRALPNEDGRFEQPYAGDLWTLVSEAQSARLSDFKNPGVVGGRFEDVRGLGRRLGRVGVFSKMLRVSVQTLVHAKMTEAEADLVLAARPEIGRSVVSLEPTAAPARGSYAHNLDSDPFYVPQMDVPRLTLREYHRPVVSRGQVVSSDNVLLPDTYRHHLAPRMVNVHVEESAPRFGRIRRDISSPEQLPGAWFQLDSEWPGHFGHTMTEVLGRLWAWERVKAERPDVKCLLTVQHDRVPAELLPFETDLLAAFGIAREDVHIFDRPCQPESLYAATSMFSLPDYIHPDIRQTWDRVGDFLAARAEQRERPRRIFCTRSEGLKRSCRNTADVEGLFRRHGFEVIRPEDYPVAEQVAMFRAAEAVGGFAGSGLFTLALCDSPKRVFAVGPTTYTARNEHLIANVRGHDMVSAWSTPDHDHPPGSWTQRAFVCEYLFDTSAEGVFLADQLARLAPSA